jgi:hypothetical protein
MTRGRDLVGALEELTAELDEAEPSSGHVGSVSRGTRGTAPDDLPKAAAGGISTAAGIPAMYDSGGNAWGDEAVFGSKESGLSRAELANVAARDGLTRGQLGRLAREGWHRSQLGISRTVCHPVVNDGDESGDGDPWRWLD